MYKLKFTLKQHTPLIHFQHAQDGATLRASEVKPKLDRFILNDLEKIDPEIYISFKQLIDQFRINSSDSNSPRLYKLSIIQSDPNNINKYLIASEIKKDQIEKYRHEYEILSLTPYFADNKNIKDGTLDKAKLGLMLKPNCTIDLIFKFYNPQLLNFLSSVIPLFLTKTNFGARQNKGFGCFHLEHTRPDQFEALLLQCLTNVFKNSIKHDNLDKVFKSITEFYKKLKAGDRTSDSLLRKYFNAKRPVIDWEKVAIQRKVEEITGMNLKIRSKTNEPNQIQFIRALLGLPEIFEYPKHDKIKVQVDHNNTEDKIKIERYPSPLIFKVFNNAIYLSAMQENIDKEISNKEFYFHFDRQGRKYNKMLTLKTPKDEFKVNDFLTIAMNSLTDWKKL